MIAKNSQLEAVTTTLGAFLVGLDAFIAEEESKDRKAFLERAFGRIDEGLNALLMAREV